MKILFGFVIFLITIHSLQAKDDLVYRYFSFKHPTCTIWLHQKDSAYWKSFGDDFRDTVFEKLKLKRLNIKFIKKSTPLLITKGDLHLTLSKSILPKGLYKKCLVKFEILISSNKYISANDDVLFTRDSLRAFPRHTFRGEERCQYALKDTFGIIPYCSKKPLQRK